MKKIIPVLLGVLTLSSCSIHRQITKDTKAHDPEVNAASFGMVIKPIVADLKVESAKQSVTYTADLKLPLSELKNNAMDLFLSTHKCDYVVDPVFSRVSSVDNSILSDIKITVTGFPASYSKVYQVDSLPKSVMQYSSISLPVKRVEYINSITEETKGKAFGMEFASGTSFAGAQIDYAKDVNGLHYYFSIENYSDPNTVNFEYIYRNRPKATIAAESNHTTVSVGVFKEKIFSPKFKIRGSGGLNYSSMPFTTSIAIPSDSLSFTTARSIGLRFGAAADYRIFKGISIVGRAHANVNMLNFVAQDGISTAKVDNISFAEKRLLNISLGIRFNF